MRGLGVGPITAFHNLVGPHGEGDAHHILKGKERFPRAVAQARIDHCNALPSFRLA